MPVDHNLLSVTVLAPNCMYADAFATAFMVMGLNKCQAFLLAHPELRLEVFCIYENEDGQMNTFSSPGMAEVLRTI